MFAADTISSVEIGNDGDTLVCFQRLYPCIKISCGNLLFIEILWLKCYTWLQLKHKKEHGSVELCLTYVCAETGLASCLAPLSHRLAICQPLLACLWSCSSAAKCQTYNQSQDEHYQACDMSHQKPSKQRTRVISRAPHHKMLGRWSHGHFRCSSRCTVYFKLFAASGGAERWTGSSRGSDVAQKSRTSTYAASVGPLPAQVNTCICCGY